ncbi:AfsR/SARP family transcriptional regulator [Actinokineospora enzanensis]|uniref:AfsR/SARP family transcriptional regulator n=1 Tax=Actinokineospora enzanensis TaxID=155975 RepID=UPI0003623B07|nr:BTAD domain-containing putative transcriptional regulator [Actinokineospora enzanensis]
MEFRVLGSVEVHEAGRAYRPRAAKLRDVLRLLVFRAGEFVATDTIMQELWEDNPPVSSITTTQTYIYHLRRAFAEELGVPRPEDVLTTRQAGYLLRADPADTDCGRFAALIGRGRDLAGAGRWAEAAAALREALALWHEPHARSATVTTLNAQHLEHYQELHRAAVELRVTADLRQGRHRELIPELRALVLRNPLNEWFHAQLISCLGVSGRRGEALEAYRSARRIIIDELGLEPSVELQRVHREMLATG